MIKLASYVFSPCFLTFVAVINPYSFLNSCFKLITYYTLCKYIIWLQYLYSSGMVECSVTGANNRKAFI